MNILILSNNYKKGGMETRLCTEATQLKKHSFHLIATEIIKTEYTSFFVNMTGYYDNLDLDDYIRKNKIDVVHAQDIHSYKWVLKIKTNIKKIATVHGPATLAAIRDDDISLDSLFRTFDLVIPVSTEIKDSLPKSLKNVHVIRNLIDTDTFFEVASTDEASRKLALVSRIDDDKFESICITLSQFEIMNHNKIDTIDIYGDGTKYEDLKTFVESRKFPFTVNLKGFSSNLNIALGSNYLCVLGMGRALLESSIMNIPVCLVGYNGPIDFVTSANFNKFASRNFSGRGCLPINPHNLSSLIDMLIETPEKFQIRELVANNYSSKNLVDYYIKKRLK